MAISKDELAVMGKQLSELMVLYNAVTISIFERVLSMNEKRLVILFKDQNGKVVAEREFPKV